MVKYRFVVLALTVNWITFLGGSINDIKSQDRGQAMAVIPDGIPIPVETDFKAVESRLRFPFASEFPITSGFGWRQHPILHKRIYHNGIDIGAPYGAPVLAAMPGKVVKAAYTEAGGNTEILENEDKTFRTAYVHLSKMTVSEGESVEQGAVIGYVGGTGSLSTGPHLHFEVRVREGESWTAINPASSLGQSIPDYTPPSLPSISPPAVSSGSSAVENMPLCDRAMWDKCTKPPQPRCEDVLWGDECKKELRKKSSE